MDEQKPLELILARNLLSTVSTPAFLVGAKGMLLFFNDAAAAMLGRRFEETGNMTAEQWTRTFGPVGDNGEPIPYDEIPATIAIRNERPYHGNFRIRSAEGNHETIAASSIPIIGAHGPSGAIVIFWPITAEQPGERQ